MEIGDYIAAIRRRLWVPVLLPILAGGLTAGFIYLQPQKYEATATVVVPALSARGYSTSAVTQYVSTFKDVLISVPVIEKVSQDNGVPAGELVSGLSASTATASSNIIVITYVGKQKSKVAAVVRDAAIVSLDALMAPQVAAAQNEVAASQAALDVANKQIQDWTAKNGMLQPDVDYRVKTDQLGSLLVQLEQAKLAGDKTRAAGLQAIVAARQKELENLAPKVVDYHDLVDAKSAAVNARNKAQVDLVQVNAQVASNHSAGSVTISKIFHVSRAPETLRFGGVAFAVALILALALLVLQEFLRPARVADSGIEAVVVPAAPDPPAASSGAAAETNGHTPTPVVVGLRTSEASPERDVPSISGRAATKSP